VLPRFRADQEAGRPQWVNTSLVAKPPLKASGESTASNARVATRRSVNVVGEFSMIAEYVANSRSVVYEKFDDESVLINFETGIYFSLRGSAPRIWNLLQSPSTLDSIAMQIGATETLARNTIETFLTELAAQSCVLARQVEEIEVVGSPASAGDAEAFEPPILQAFQDLQELIVVDPVHEVDAKDGWPHRLHPFGLSPNSR
jgi:hypothetical protein